MSAAPARMALRDAVGAIHAARRADEVVITAMGAAREWQALGPLQPLDLVHVPSSMGEAPPLGLGIALAQPGRRVIVLNGDGSTLMNLGSLVTITSERPAALTLVVLDNGVYEVTGAQPTPGSAPGRRGTDALDFTALARACGFQAIYRFSDGETWRRDARQVIDGEGPAFVLLDVAPVPGARGPRSPGPTSERARRFMAALRGEAGP
jgi:sulfopyruvate decarboxylase subunit beta